MLQRFMPFLRLCSLADKRQVKKNLIWQKPSNQKEKREGLLVKIKDSQVTIQQLVMFYCCQICFCEFFLKKRKRW